MAAAANQACCIITPTWQLDALFLFQYLLAFREELIDLGRGSGQPNISQEILRSLRLPVPSMDAQREIVAELASSQARSRAISKRLGKQIELLQEHRQALITAAVTAELDVPGVAA